MISSVSLQIVNHYFFKELSEILQNMSIPDDVLKNYINQIFQKYDRDNSGTLDAGELAMFFNDVFQMMGNPTRVNQQQAMQALTAIDKNNDGKASKQ